MPKYEELSRAIEESVRRSCKGKRVGVACSGGLDSGLVSALVKRYADKVTLYTCGTKNSFDVKAGMDLAERLNLPWVHCRLNKGDMHSLIREFVEATGDPDPFTVSYEMQLFTVCKTAEEDIIVSGQGSDEYFMGCAKFVGASPEDYEVLRRASVERLLNVSVPCELRIAEHFGKTMVYPYLDPSVTEEISRLDPEELRPKDMDSRKSVLKEIAVQQGYGFLTERPKKSSQYGSGTTDLIRGLAKEQNMMYAEYIASIRDEVTHGSVPLKRGAVINARIDPIVKEKAERILLKNGKTPSQVIEELYRRIIEEDGSDES